MFIFILFSAAPRHFFLCDFVSILVQPYSGQQVLVMKNVRNVDARQIKETRIGLDELVYLDFSPETVLLHNAVNIMQITYSGIEITQALL